MHCPDEQVHSEVCFLMHAPLESRKESCRPAAGKGGLGKQALINGAEKNGR